MTQECKCCGRSRDTRMGYCFDCVDCESVIVDGVDMWDGEIPKIDGLSTNMSKLQYILKKFDLIKNK
jgi:hypothetical protein